MQFPVGQTVDTYCLSGMVAQAKIPSLRLYKDNSKTPLFYIKLKLFSITFFFMFLLKIFY